MHKYTLHPPSLYKLRSFSLFSYAFFSSRTSTAPNYQIQFDSVPDYHFLEGFAKPYVKESKLAQSHPPFIKRLIEEVQRAPTTLSRETLQNVELGTITDPGFFTYLLQFLLKETNLRKSDQSFDGTWERRSKALRETKTIHAQMVKAGFSLLGSLGNSLLDLYAKCGSLEFTLKIFGTLEWHDTAAWNSVLSAHLRHEMHEEVTRDFTLMWACSTRPNQCTFAIVLSACARSMDLNFGKQLHCNIIKVGLEVNSFCEGSLIDMYGKCNFMMDARAVFDRVINPDLIAWTVIIASYVRMGLPAEAIELFQRMKKLGVEADHVMVVTAITACVHLGKLQEATDIFNEVGNPSTVAWNAMISGHAQNGYEVESLRLFKNMRAKGVKPTRSTLGTVLSAIAHLTALDQGMQVHSEAIKMGLDLNVFVGSSLINMYSKCCILQGARKIFDALEERNVVLWNSMLSGLAQNGFPNEVLHLFFEMQHSDVLSDKFTYVSVLNACALLEELDMGQQIHSVIVKSNLEDSLFVGNALIDMYAKSRSLKDARKQFELVHDRDLVSWNAIIVGYAYNDRDEDALIMFNRMRQEKVSLDEVSLATSLSACANVQATKLGEQIHCLSIKSGLLLNLYVESSLVDMYAKCGALEPANKAFEQIHQNNLVSRNALIGGYVQSNCREEAFHLFRQIQAEGLKPSEITLMSILPICIGPSGLLMGKQVHGYTVKTGLLHEDMHLRASVMGLYLKYLEKEDATKLFWELGNIHGTVPWTVLISGHAQNNYNEEAISLFWEMHRLGANPDHATFVTVLNACASLTSLRNGREVHSIIIKTGFGSDEHIGSALVDMYSKCGDVEDSVQVFSRMQNKEDNISWNSMIVGYAKNGFAKECLEVFYEMQKRNIKPDEITFLGVLTACSHAGLVTEGRGFFQSMKRKYNVSPRADHCACIVDLLGRCGALKEAEEFIYSIPFSSDPIIWASLLSACRIHVDDERGKRAATRLIELEPLNSSPYVLLSSIYAASRNWEGVNMMRKAMKERGVRKLPGCSWIVVGKKTNLFIAGDKFHPKAIDIYVALDELTEVIKDYGYVTRFDLFLDEEG